MRTWFLYFSLGKGSKSKLWCKKKFWQGRANNCCRLRLWGWMGKLWSHRTEQEKKEFYELQRRYGWILSFCSVTNFIYLMTKLPIWCWHYFTIIIAFLSDGLKTIFRIRTLNELEHHFLNIEWTRTWKCVMKLEHDIICFKWTEIKPNSAFTKFTKLLIEQIWNLFFFQTWKGNVFIFY